MTKQQPHIWTFDDHAIGLSDEKRTKLHQIIAQRPKPSCTADWYKFAGDVCRFMNKEHPAPNPDRSAQPSALIQQRFMSDCAVACLAMFLKIDYEAVAKHCSGIELVQTGLTWIREEYIASLFGVRLCVLDRSLIDWAHPHILSLPSLNNPKGGTHAVYWDGTRAWDPQQGRPGRLHYSNQEAQRQAITGIIREELFGVAA